MSEDLKKTRSHKYIETKEETKDTGIKEPKKEEKKSTIPRILTILAIIIIAFLAYITLITPSLFEVHEFKIETNKITETFHGLKIVHLSDIHYGTTINQKQLDKIVKKINNIKPDIIFFTGDLIDKNIVTTKEIKEEIITSLSKLECTLYKYAIYGNEDYNNKEYQSIMESSGFILLNNEIKPLYYESNTPILIIGFNSMDNNPDYSLTEKNIEDLNSSLLYKIVLSHEPDSIDKIINYKPDLVLSGHTLGGLIKLPFIKPLFLEKGATEYYKDYYKINNTELYISNGLGTSGINARLNNHPSINLYRLYKKDSK